MHPLASLFVLAADGVNVVEAYVVDNERGAREGGAPASEAVAIPEDEEQTPDAPFGQRLKEVCRLSLAIAVVLLVVVVVVVVVATRVILWCQLFLPGTKCS